FDLTSISSRSFFLDTSTTAIYTLSLHDALPISEGFVARMEPGISAEACLYADLGIDPGRHGVQSMEATHFLVYDRVPDTSGLVLDRKSTRLNSSHVKISYAVFCLKKKINITNKI